MKRRRLIQLLVIIIALASAARLWWKYRDHMEPSPIAGRWSIDAVDNQPIQGNVKPTVKVTDRGEVSVDLAGNDFGTDLTAAALQQSLVDLSKKMQEDERKSVNGMKVTIRPVTLVLAVGNGHSVKLSKLGK